MRQVDVDLSGEVTTFKYRLNSGKKSDSRIPTAVGDFEDMESRITIDRLALADGGHYKCTARNPYGEPVDHTILVNIQGE